ncbi:MAG: hypothetical protein GF320_15315 [Armatimonadia bacterium]|nr:hypothetical protein [Armatimonadia bacterium]
MRTRTAFLLALLALSIGAGLLAGCGGYEAFLVPTRLRLTPGITTAAPGEIVRYELKGFSLVGIEIPLPTQSAKWNLYDEPLPSDVKPPAGTRDAAVPGVIDLNGRFEASPVVQPGHYRSGLIRASTVGTISTLTASVHVIVDGDIDPDAPKLEVWPRNLRVPVGTEVPFVTLAIDPRNGRVAPAEDDTWSVLSGPGQMATSEGVYTVTGVSDSQEVEVLAISDSGRRASTYMTLDPNPSGPMANIHLVPEGTLKVALGRSQKFLLYGTDSEGRYVPIPDAEWLVEGGIGEISEKGDGTVGFLAQAAGEGTLVASRGDKIIRRSIIAVIPGA